MSYKKGVICGNFDVIHPGYIKMFKECKTYCKQLIVLLHIDPSIERPEKLKPILTKQERTEILTSPFYLQDYPQEDRQPTDFRRYA